MSCFHQEIYSWNSRPCFELHVPKVELPILTWSHSSCPHDHCSRRLRFAMATVTQILDALAPSPASPLLLSHAFPWLSALSIFSALCVPSASGSWGAAPTSWLPSSQPPIWPHTQGPGWPPVPIASVWGDPQQPQVSLPLAFPGAAASGPPLTPKHMPSMWAPGSLSPRRAASCPLLGLCTWPFLCLLHPHSLQKMPLHPHHPGLGTFLSTMFSPFSHQLLLWARVGFVVSASEPLQWRFASNISYHFQLAFFSPSILYTPWGQGQCPFQLSLPLDILLVFYDPT